MAASNITWLGFSVDEIRAELRGPRGEPGASLSVFSLPDLPGGEPAASAVDEPFQEKLKGALDYTISVYLGLSRHEAHKAEEYAELHARFSRAAFSLYSDLTLVLGEGSSVAVYCQGYELASSVLRQAAIDTQTPFVAFENTFHRGKIIWDDTTGKTTNTEQVRKAYLEAKGTIDPDEAEAFAEAYVANIASLKSAEHRIADSTKLSLEGYVLFIGQVYTDSSLYSASGQWQDSVDAILHCLEVCLELGRPLFVKLHPKEHFGNDPVRDQPYEDLTHRKLMQSKGIAEALGNGTLHMDHRAECNTYQLIRQSKCVVTINSQAGLEACLLGAQVINLSHSLYSGLGFTFDTPTRDAFEDQLAQLIATDQRDPSHKREAQRFAYFFLTQYCVGSIEEFAGKIRGKMGEFR